MKPILEVKNLTYIYSAGTPFEHKALDDISFSVERGEFIGIIGHTGSGKSTLMQQLNGLLKPTSGTVLLDGRDVTALPPERRPVNTVFQSYALFPHMTVFDNVAFGLKMRKLDKATIERDVMQMLKLVDLEGFENRYPREMSGGQRQRVALARAMVIKPDLMLFDEPLSNLDAKLRVKMRVEIRRIQQELGFTAIYVTHDQEEALILADSIAVMSEGELLQLGSAEEVFRHPANDYIASFLGLNDIVWKDDGSVL